MYVGDTTPVITSITPNVWNAGVVTPFTITGSGFGTNPFLTIIGTDITVYAITGLPSDTRISATVTVDPNAITGPATVTVQSNGYNGRPFQSQQPGQPRQASAVVTLFGEPAPVPRIVDRNAGSTCQNGPNIAGTTQNVFAGQQIALTGCIDPPPGLLVTGQWSPPQGGTAIGGYTVTATQGQVVPLPSAAAADYTFFWVDSGNSRQMTFNATVLNGNSSPATVTFNVAGPTQQNIKTTPGTTYISPPPTPLLQFGSSAAKAGMRFEASATLPAGKPGILFWVQLIKKDQITQIAANGKQTCVFPGFAKTPDVPELDTLYPYFFETPTTTYDVPFFPLPQELGEFARDFSATMYLMWDPLIPVGCTGGINGTCASIPVPLASVTWRSTGDAINTLKTQPNGTTWTLSCSGPDSNGNGLASPVHVSVPATDKDYPIWQEVLYYPSAKLTCQ
jgi:hypothetical protein